MAHFLDPRPRWGEVGIHGVARAREWDAVAIAAADLPGDEARFAALPDGEIVVEAGPEDVGALAAALARSLAPPYRAEAVRRGDGRWAVAGRTIRVERLPGLTGEVAELTVSPEGKRASVDGHADFGALARLERLLEGGQGHVLALRLRGDLYEIRLERL